MDEKKSENLERENQVAQEGPPTRAPDYFEQEHGDQIDNSVPTMGYHTMPIIGLGGSAGSVKALQAFFQAMAPDTGMAFVVVMHLSPEHESSMPLIISRWTPMKVVAAKDGTRVHSNCVYVIPHGKHLFSLDGQLQLADLEPRRGKRVAVDLFFRSLADTHGPRAIAVVLSGADSDGSIGIKRIKERGGLTIAQDPDEAEHHGMPQSAISTGMVDWILPVAQMPARIIDYISREQKLRVPPEDGPQPVQVAPPASESESEAALRELLAFLRARTGRDFSYYKRATVIRRVSRRMQINGLHDVPAYLSFLRTHPGEAGALLQDLLISVTNFYRDREAFVALEKLVPELFRNRGPGDTVRVWTPGCATGEESYSLAIMLLEHARKLDAPPSVQVFGCDLDDAAIQVARAGIYSETIEADVSEERLRGYFIKDRHGYRVRREVREVVLFASHDLLKDAPFSRMDLVSCRNLLIYLNRDAQRRALDIFHFALRPKGLLLLGTSESVEEDSTLFDVLDKKHRIFRHRATQKVGLPVPIGPSTLLRALEAQEQAHRGPVLHSPSFARSATPPGAEVSTGNDNLSLGELHFKLVERFAPPSVVVNTDYEIVHLSENAGRFLIISGGEPTLNLLRVVHPMLRLEVRAALIQATETGQTIEVKNLPIELGGKKRGVTIQVSPSRELVPGFLLVTFETTDLGGDETRPTQPLEPEPVVRQLEREIEIVKLRLRDTVEQYEGNTEELKASNEELQAINEELRSATEELETSREELQSINEELATVNTELKSKLDELSHANSDLHNLMAATAIATLFVDRELRITRYTPPAVRLFKLIPGDLGRPLADLRNMLEYPELSADAEMVLQQLTPIEREIRSFDEWFLARFLPYRTLDDRIAGVVLTFVDITEGKRADAALRVSEERLRRMVNVPQVGVLTFDYEGNLLNANDAFLETMGYTHQDVKEKTFHWRDFTPKNLVPERQQVMEQVRASGRGGPYEQEFIRKDGSLLWLMFVAADIGDGTIVEYAIDVSERKYMERVLHETQERYRLAVENVRDYAILTLDLNNVFTSWNLGAERIFGYSETEVLGEKGDLIFTEEDRQTGQVELELKNAAIRDRAADERWHVRKDGSKFWSTGVMHAIYDEHTELRGYVKVLRDETDRRRAEEEVHAAKANLEIRVAERTEELRRANADLQKEVTERLRLLGELVTAQEQERERISRELHDHLGQNLTGLLLGLSAVQEQTRSDEELYSRMAALRRDAERLGGELHNLALELRPPVLDEHGLKAAVLDHLGDWSERMGIPIDVQWMVPDEEQFEPPIQTTLYRILQEALNNISRHSSATHVVVIVSRQADTVQMIVEDDGRGFVLDEIVASGPGRRLGLVGMRERAKLLKGSLEIETMPDKGTSIFCRLPIRTSTRARKPRKQKKK